MQNYLMGWGARHCLLPRFTGAVLAGPGQVILERHLNGWYSCHHTAHSSHAPSILHWYHWLLMPQAYLHQNCPAQFPKQGITATCCVRPCDHNWRQYSLVSVKDENHVVCHVLGDVDQQTVPCGCLTKVWPCCILITNSYVAFRSAHTQDLRI